MTTLTPSDASDIKHSKTQQSQNNSSLDLFLSAWDNEYKNEVKNIKLFNPELTSLWSQQQKALFAKMFYHSRGYFRDFLWHLGNFAPNKKIKMIVLENIAEEFNDNNKSHEQYYLDFAKLMGVDLKDEILNQTSYTDEMKKFNKMHIVWLHENDWQKGFAAFSAYERLDKTDYELLSKLTSPEHIFFKIHREAQHFDKTYMALKDIWKQNKNKVQEAFYFIGKAQAKMWTDLSDNIFNYTDVPLEHPKVS